MRETSLKPDKNGVIWRNLGWKKTRTGQRSQHKFNLGTSRKEAQARLVLLKRLWQSIQEREGQDTSWSEFTLKIGTVIASGKTEVVVEHRKTKSYVRGVEWCYVDDATYASAVNDAQTKYLFIKFVPESPEAYQRGVEKLASLYLDVGDVESWIGVAAVRHRFVEQMYHRHLETFRVIESECSIVERLFDVS